MHIGAVWASKILMLGRTDRNINTTCSVLRSGHKTVIKAEKDGDPNTKNGRHA